MITVQDGGALAIRLSVLGTRVTDGQRFRLSDLPAGPVRLSIRAENDACLPQLRALVLLDNELTTMPRDIMKLDLLGPKGRLNLRGNHLCSVHPDVVAWREARMEEDERHRKET
jgi:hypothetical protein